MSRDVYAAEIAAPLGLLDPAECGLHALEHPPLQGRAQRGVLQPVHDRAFNLGQLQCDATFGQAVVQLGQHAQELRDAARALLSVIR